MRNMAFWVALAMEEGGAPAHCSAAPGAGSPHRVRQA